MNIIKFIIYFFTVLNLPLFPHTIITKDLKVIYGIVSSQDNQYVHFQTETGKKKIRKDQIGKIIIQDLKDNQILKKFIKKVKETYPPIAEIPTNAIPAPSQDIQDIEFESSKILLAEIEEEEKLLALKDKSRSAFLSSFLFPGWGQYRLENRKTGIFYAALFSACILASIYHKQNSDNSYSKYEREVHSIYKFAYIANPELPDSSRINYYFISTFQQKNLYNQYLNDDSRKENMLLGAFAIYLLQIFHTYYDVKLINTEKVGDAKLSFSITPAKSWERNIFFSPEVHFSLQFTW